MLRIVLSDQLEENRNGIRQNIFSNGRHHHAQGRCHRQRRQQLSPGGRGCGRCHPQQSGPTASGRMPAHRRLSDGRGLHHPGLPSCCKMDHPYRRTHLARRKQRRGRSIGLLLQELFFPGRAARHKEHSFPGYQRRSLWVSHGAGLPHCP